MKKILLSAVIACIAFLVTAFSYTEENSLTGAWKSQDGDNTYTVTFQDGYLSYSSFNIPAKKFIRSFGGPYNISGNTIIVKGEFDSQLAETIGTEYKFVYTFKNKKLTAQIGEAKKWDRVDNGMEGLAGNWRISGRLLNNQMEQVPLRARRTLKLLSATRFQWMAINIETKEFLGTGGATYTLKDGKYTETIEFFSRDSSRVGASLSFDYSLKEGVWIHQGLSSKGAPIYEEWSRLK